MNPSSLVQWFYSAEQEGVVEFPSPSRDENDELHVIEVGTEPLTPASDEQETEIEAYTKISVISVARWVGYAIRGQDAPGLASINSSSSAESKISAVLSEIEASSESSLDVMEKGRKDTPTLVEEEPHLKLFAHDRQWTCVALFSTWMGFMFAHLARSSAEFVTLEIPIYVDALYNTVSNVGMLNLELCYNETFAPSLHGCVTDRLGSDEIGDTTFQAARSLAFLAILIGGFMSVMMTSAVVWYSINLRPIGLGYLIAYFLQSFTFLFFDTDLCTAHGCLISSGGYQCIAASLFWIASCIAVSRMDAIKFRTAERKRRRFKRKLNKFEKMNLKSPATTRTSSSSTEGESWDASSSDESASDPDIGIVSSFPASSDAVETSMQNVAAASSDEEDVEQNTPWLTRQTGNEFSRRERIRMVTCTGPEPSPPATPERRNEIEVTTTKSNHAKHNKTNKLVTPPRNKDPKSKRSKNKSKSPKSNRSKSPGPARSTEKYRIVIVTDS